MAAGQQYIVYVPSRWKSFLPCCDLTVAVRTSGAEFEGGADFLNFLHLFFIFLRPKEATLLRFNPWFRVALCSASKHIRALLSYWTRQRSKMSPFPWSVRVSILPCSMRLKHCLVFNYSPTLSISEILFFSSRPLHHKENFFFQDERDPRAEPTLRVCLESLKEQRGRAANGFSTARLKCLSIWSRTRRWEQQGDSPLAK